MHGLKNRIISLPAFCVLLGIFCGGSACADGMFIAPRGSFMYETAQQALLEWDEEAASETLTILPSFYGDAYEFAWVVPVPSLPQVEMAEQYLFRSLDHKTAPIYRHRDGEWDCFQDSGFDVASTDQGGGVNVIDFEMVGFYKTLILQSDSSTALLDTLSSWGFLHVDNQEQVAESFSSYVDRSWFFVAMQVDSTSLAQYWEDPYTKTRDKAVPAPWYYYGWGLEPVTFSFASDEPVYPMRVSSYSAWDNTAVNLYVKADHRMTFPGAETLYANSLCTEEGAEWAMDSALGGRFAVGDYVTKLHRSYTPQEMVEDIVLTRAGSDDEFRWIYYSGLPLTTLLLLGPPVVYGIWRGLGKRRRRATYPEATNPGD